VRSPITMPRRAALQHKAETAYLRTLNLVYDDTWWSVGSSYLD
jgi:hypothetical protein